MGAGLGYYCWLDYLWISHQYDGAEDVADHVNGELHDSACPTKGCPTEQYKSRFFGEAGPIGHITNGIKDGKTECCQQNCELGGKHAVGTMMPLQN